MSEEEERARRREIYRRIKNSPEGAVRLENWLRQQSSDPEWGLPDEEWALAFSSVMREQRSSDMANFWYSLWKAQHAPHSSMVERNRACGGLGRLVQEDRVRGLPEECRPHLLRAAATAEAAVAAADAARQAAERAEQAARSAEEARAAAAAALSAAEVAASAEHLDPAVARTAYSEFCERLRETRAIFDQEVNDFVNS